MPTRARPKKVSLDDLEHKSVEEASYRRKLKEKQLELLQLQRRLCETKHSVIAVFEGPDAAGKGGCIKRCVERLDPRLVRVYSIVKPTAEEYQHHYLWRFWNKLPAHGQLSVFDRSWYGRVLVERVEKFASPAEWQRAYREINEFERTLTDDGVILLKFYLHITKDEQLARFRRRQADPYKHWKINDEDWRNRRKWDAHNRAAEEMFRRTDSAVSWHVIAANYKWHTRLKVLKTMISSIQSILE